MSTVERLDEAVRLVDASAYGVRFTDLVVRYGEVVALTGPNGSGKSTVSRAVVGELTIAGSVQVLGVDPVAAGLKERIGYLVKDLDTLGSLTSRDVLDICAAVRGCGTAYAHQLAGRIGLALDRPMAQLSRGELRRLGIVQALMHEPELVVLDDPATELDDEARQVLRGLLREAAARGAGVLVTAQSESDAEQYADRVVPVSGNDVSDDQSAQEHAADVEPEHDLAPVGACIARGAERRDTTRTAAVELVAPTGHRPGHRTGAQWWVAATDARQSVGHGQPPRPGSDPPGPFEPLVYSWFERSAFAGTRSALAH